ncbi:MAG: hypothetical protein N2517_02605 [Ignavibacteria bacterium]|nr:hypothetical protein [Ignavibacteria bacterium]
MKIKGWLILTLIISLLIGLLPLDELSARKGGKSFGGSRGSFRTSPKSFGGTKSPIGTRSYDAPMTSPKNFTPRSQQTTPRSFGGSVSSNVNKFNLQSKYGIPRKQITSREMSNLPPNVVVNDYGNFASGLMMGYLLGHTSWLWFTPFHPAFYYSQPIKVENPDGTISYYPPTFDFGKLLMTLIVLGSLGFILYTYFKNKKLRLMHRSSDGFSKSSFG